MKTAMQELMEWIGKKETELSTTFPDILKLKVFELIQKEKQQHRNSFEFGVNTLSVYRSRKLEKEKRIFEDYYSKTYTNQTLKQ